MRRLFAAAMVCAAFVVLTGVAAADPWDHPARGHDVDHAAAVRGATPLAAKARVLPLGARRASITISCRVLDSSGTPSSGATVVWYAPAGSTWYSGRGTTDASGDVTLTAIPAAGHGELWVYPAGGGTLARGGETWSDGSSFTFFPGRLTATGYRGGPWNDFDNLSVSIWSDTRSSYGSIAASDTTSSPVSGDFDALNGPYTTGALYFFDDEGLEFSGSVNVASGSFSSGAITGYEASAQRITVSSPYWASGAPGSTIKVACGNFPAGWANGVTGQSEYPSSAPVKDFGTKASGGGATESVTLKVPTSATPGYWYNIDMGHLNGLQALDLHTPFQVCTMRPSRTSIRRGTKIRVTGVVPIYGHWGDQKGTPKTVTLFAHRGKAGVPTKWNPKRQGWVAVGSVKTNAYGKYVTPYFKPLKTLTLVVRYPGDDWWWDAYTSAKKITVR
jgi:hypothetical protein